MVQRRGVINLLGSFYCDDATLSVFTCADSDMKNCGSGFGDAPHVRDGFIGSNVHDTDSRYNKLHTPPPYPHVLHGWYGLFHGATSIVDDETRVVL